jgi:chromosome segregation ATPase
MESAASTQENILHDQSERLGEVFARLQKAVTTLKKHEQTREKDAKLAAQQMEELKQKNAKLSEEIAALKTERDQLRQQVKHLDGRNQNLQKHMDQVSSKLEAAITKIGELID